MRENRTVAIKFFFSAMEAAKLLTSRRASMLQQSSSIACQLTFSRLESARSLERRAALSS